MRKPIVEALWSDCNEGIYGILSRAMLVLEDTGNAGILLAKTMCKEVMAATSVDEAIIAMKRYVQLKFIDMD